MKRLVEMQSKASIAQAAEMADNFVGTEDVPQLDLDLLYTLVPKGTMSTYSHTIFWACHETQWQAVSRWLPEFCTGKV